MRTGAQTVETSNAATARGKIFKADHPRAVDAYIHYFGGRAADDVSPEKDLCGEGFLDAFAGRGGNPFD